MTALQDSGGGARQEPKGDHALGRRRLHRIIDRLKRARAVLIVTALVFAGLWEGGALALMPALVGFLVIAGVVLIRAASEEATRQAVPRDDAPALRLGDPTIEAVLAGLPDPVVALNRQGEVVALNARAGAIAPALRRGEPVSLALRVPEVLNAIRRAVASGGAQRVEFFERIPLDRWYEAIVTP